MRAGWSNWESKDDWIAGNPVKIKVGLDENGFISISSLQNDGVTWVAHARTTYPAPQGSEFHLGIKTANSSSRVYTAPKVHLLEPAAPTMYFRYIESPDGNYQYPLFATEEEANYYDQNHSGTTGSGTSHTHVYADDPTNTTWYMPDTGRIMSGSTPPLDAAHTVFMGSTVSYTEISSLNDSGLIPPAFTDTTIMVNELSAVNYQLSPVDVGYVTTIGGIPNWSVINGTTLFGTAPEVTGDNVSNPSDTTTVTIYRTNSYGTSTGTLTIVINNLTPPTTAPDGFTLTEGTMADADTLDSGSVVTLDDTLAVGKRLIVSKSWVETNVLPNITGALEKAYVGVPSPNANWTNAPDLHIDFDAVMRWEGQSSNAHKSTMADGSDTVARSENSVGSTTNAYYNYAIQWDGTDLVVMADIDAAKLANEHDYTQMQRYSAYENYSEQSGNLPLVFATKSGGQMDVTMSGISFIDIPVSNVGDQLSSQINYTPSYLFSVGSTYSSYENYTSGSTPYDTFGINQISFTNSFITIYFKDSTSISAFRSGAHYIELIADDGSDPSWEGVYSLGSDNEYSVSYSYNYIHYQPLSYTEQENLVAFISAGGISTNVLDLEITSSPVTLTSWTKALDFSGSSERTQQVGTSTNYMPIGMDGISTTVSGHATDGYTSGNVYSRPFACAIVFRADGNNSNQHIWNQGEGASSTSDNIYLRLSSNRQLFFGWGRDGALNELYIGTITANRWYGIYIGHTGERLSGANATGVNLSKCFDVRLMSDVDGFSSISDQGTAAEWNNTGYSTIGGRMDRSVTGNFTIGGRGANRNFHGKVASMVVTTLRINQPMPDDNEVKLMITDPIKWLQDYKDGNTYRVASSQAEATFGLFNYLSNSALATQVWLMGDGTLDNYSNMIRNQVYPQDQNYTKLNMISMVSNDIQNVTINGLT